MFLCLAVMEVYANPVIINSFNSAQDWTGLKTTPHRLPMTRNGFNNVNIEGGTVGYVYLWGGTNGKTGVIQMGVPDLSGLADLVMTSSAPRDVAEHLHVSLYDGSWHSVILGDYGSLRGSMSDVTIPLKDFGANLNAVSSLKLEYKAPGFIAMEHRINHIEASGIGNTAPIARSESYSVDEDHSLTVNGSGVLSNDTDDDGDALTASITQQSANGTVTLNSNGSFVFVPDHNFFGATSFSYRAFDGIAYSGPVTVSLTVNGVNDAPTGLSDSYSTLEENTLTVGAPGVLSNDTDPDNDRLTVELVSAVTSGVLILDSNGSFEYSPVTDWHGTTQFSYRAFDGVAYTDTVVVQLVVTSVNDAPIAAHDHYSLHEDSTLVVAASGVLANDSDLEGDALTAVLVSPAHNGTVQLQSNGSFSYSPDVNFFGLDSFSYTAYDGTDASNIAFVVFDIAGQNDAPVASNDAVTVSENSTVTVNAPGLLSNDTDVDTDLLTVELSNDVAHGSLALNSDGSFTYTPDQYYAGVDSFTYRAKDATTYSNSAVVTITINAIAPVITAQPQDQSVLVGGMATFSVSAVGSSVQYQWYKNGIALAGATSAQYISAAATIADDSTRYSVTVSNIAGLVVSDDATLLVSTIPVPPVVITEPVSQTTKEGKAVLFNFVATGTGPLSYQWYREGVAITGAVSESYTTPILQRSDDSTHFFAIVTNTLGSDTTNTVLLTVLATVPENKKIAIAGELYDTNGTPLGNPVPVNIDFSVSLFTAEAGGNILYTENFLESNGEAITVSNGHFVVRLGEGVATVNLQQVVSNNARIWVELTVNDGTPDVLSPRTPMTASPYSLTAPSSVATVPTVLEVAGEPNNLGVTAAIGTYCVNTLDGSTWLKINLQWIIVE